MKISLPIIPILIWLEVNVYGRTILPECFCIATLLGYGYICLKLKSEINTTGMELGNI